MYKVEASRSSKSHKLNERSSRSHCVITITMPRKSQRKFMIVDLAGSERILKSGSIEESLKVNEAKNINTSLTSLGRCITALGKNEKFIPFRDSVLTMVLKQSLGGGCFTSVIITVSEDKEMYSETLSSIQFGRRCSKVSNNMQEIEIFNMQNLIDSHLSEIRQIDEQLQKHIEDGTNGGINSNFPRCTQQSFQSNIAKYQKYMSSTTEARQRIKSGERGAIELTLRYEDSQIKNLQGILIRSMMTGVWKDPSDSYIKRLQRRNELIAALRGLGENVDNQPEKSVPLTFGHLLRGFTG